MPPDRLEPGSAADWLARARSNLFLARQPKPDGAFWEDLCFQAQQAAAVDIWAKRMLSERFTFPPYSCLPSSPSRPGSSGRRMK